MSVFWIVLQTFITGFACGGAFATYAHNRSKNGQEIDANE